MKLPLPTEQFKKKLVDEGLITPERFDSLLDESERKNQSFLDILISERVVDSEFLGSFLAQAIGVERVNFITKPLDEKIVKVLPEEIARQRQVVLFGIEPSGVYDAAMSDPSDLETIEFLTQYLKAKIKPFLAMPDDLNRGFSVYGYRMGQDFKKIIEENIRASL